MTDKKKTEELRDDELDDVTGGGVTILSTNLKSDIDAVKPSLTEASGIRANGVRASGKDITMKGKKIHQN